jgi:hypothetical protein
LVEYARSGKGEDGQGRASQAQTRSTGVKWGIPPFVGLKQFPAYLNRWDSQQARNEGVFAH